MTTSRRLAFDVLQRVHVDEAYSHLALDAALEASDLEGPDRGLATALVYGVLTWERALDRLIDRASHRGLKGLNSETLDLLRVGVYQLRFLDRVPDHAALDETVAVARNVPGADHRLVNAVLRRAAAHPDEPWWGAVPERKPARWLGERWSLPNWLGNRLHQQFGLERAASLAEAFTTAPPIWVREIGGGAVRLERLDDAARARIEAGEIVVQDLGAQRVVDLCAAGPDDTVLDACAGLGGKTLHLAASAKRVVAVDPALSKLELLSAAATRLGLADRIRVVPGVLSTELDDAPFDGVLVDAPCTGLGVLRRHPETRWRRTEPDIGRVADVQRDLLDIAAGLVRPGGWLVYSVCTWTREETSKQVEQFLERHPRFALDGDYLVTMPDSDDADGFFGARFVSANG